MASTQELTPAMQAALDKAAADKKKAAGGAKTPAKAPAKKTTGHKPAPRVKAGGGSTASAATSDSSLLNAPAPTANADTSGLSDYVLTTYDLTGSAAGAAALTNPNRQGSGNAPYKVSDTLGPLTGGWSAPKVADLQQKMRALGLYGNASFTLGKWGPADQAALRILLTASNDNQKNFTQQLQEWAIRPPSAADIAAYAGGGQQKTQKVVQLANPADIRATASNVVTDLTGGGMSDVVNNIAPAYQAEQSADQGAANNLQASGADGSFTSQPSVEGFTRDKLLKEHQDAVANKGFIDAFHAFASLMGGSG